MTNSGRVLLAATVLFWLLLCGMLNSVVGRTASGDAAMGLAIEWIYTVVLVCLTFLCLCGLLLAAKGLPDWVSVAAMFICPASGIAAMASLYLLSETSARWPAALPIIVPGLVAGYVFALSRQAWRPTVASLPVSLAVWGVAIALCVAVMPAVSRKMEEGDRKRAEHQKAQAHADAEASTRQREESLTKLKTMTPNQPLTGWYDLLNPKNGARKEALEALRKVDRRQADMEELVGRELPFYMAFYMALVPELDLKATPELCKSAHAYLAFVAKGKTAGGQDPYPYQRDEDIDSSLEAVRWFTAHGCDCGEDIATIEGNIRKHYQDSAARQTMLATLDRLKRAQ